MASPPRSARTTAVTAPYRAVSVLPAAPAVAGAGIGSRTARRDRPGGAE
ncbi:MULTISPECIES: hypothetical protein [unclassified Streptosporangium]|nr:MULTISPECIES: hypothetical protein [unclassified Streptosporangium]